MRVFSIAWMGLCGCAQQAGGPAADDPAALTLTVHPPVLGIDTEVQVAVDASRSTFVAGRTELDLGADVTVTSVTVPDGYGAVAEIAVAASAELGLRDVIVRSDGREWTLEDAVTIVPESIAITPAAARLGQLLTVEVTGKNTAFVDGVTWASFGEGVQTVSVDVHAPDAATVVVSVAPDAVPGRQDVSMENGPARVTLYDGFTVDRAAVTAVFDPPEVWQDAIVSFRIDGKDTTFLTGAPVTDSGLVTIEGDSEVEFWDGGGRNADITVLGLTVHDHDTITGTLQVSNAAALGSRDVFVTGFEDLLIPDALVVHDSPADLSAVAVGLGFDVYREIDAATGAIDEDVEAFAYFVIPLNPPCSQPVALPPPAPVPYDVNVAGEVPEPPDPADCPNPETVSAGEVVWLEGPENTVTLYKEIIESTGQIIYLSRDLTLADYHFDTWYDLHTQGDPDGVPEVLLVDVQPTVPADYALLTPQLWGGTWHDRATDLPFTWTPAQTYPVAYFEASVVGTWEASGLGGLVAALPWDDGAHSFAASELVQLAPGPVVFTAEVEIDGPRFGLPDSVIQTNKADSVLRTTGTLELR